jgi:hypothetical protein
MKRYFKNLYWRATLKRYNDGVDAGRWNVSKKITKEVQAYWAKTLDGDELAERLASIVYQEELYQFRRGLVDELKMKEREQR